MKYMRSCALLEKANNLGWVEMACACPAARDKAKLFVKVSYSWYNEILMGKIEDGIDAKVSEQDHAS